MDATEWAYLAGFIDGDGSICRCGGSVIALHVANTDKRVLDWIRVRFPVTGAINFHRRRKTHRRDYWTWDVTGRQVAPVLYGVRPFLVLKSGQAEIALELISAIGTENPLSASSRANRANLLAHLSQLNFRGDEKAVRLP